MGWLRSLFGRPSPPPRSYRLPDGYRVYAIGDVHGRRDLLEQLLARIAAERAAAPRRRDQIVFLGDLIDRGPESRGVIDLLLAAQGELPDPVFLAGNHEEMLLAILGGAAQHLPDWLRHGGVECVQSYGVDPLLLESGDMAAVAHLRAAIPEAHIDFLRAMRDSFRLGAYLFVHAGVRPGVPLESQAPRDLRWIRQSFLESDADFGAMVVHGHTVVARPEMRPNRIGIDTGAYASGVLTALCIDGGERRFLSTTAD